MVKQSTNHPLVASFHELSQLVAAKGIQLDAREVWQVAEEFHALRGSLKQAADQLDRLFKADSWLEIPLEAKRKPS